MEKGFHGDDEDDNGELLNVCVLHSYFQNKLVERGFIYQGSYEGWYCTPDESFLTSEQVTQSTDSDGNTLTVSTYIIP